MAATDLLNDLLARAGASDEDREIWLTERKSGVTATEVRELHKRGDSYAVELEKLKRGLVEDSFHGNKYTDWGNQREPVIAAKVKVLYGIEPEHRVFHAVEDSRYLASPDGVGVVDDELVLAEIKTAGKHKFPDPVGQRLFDESGYYDQMQWQLFVTGAARCLYVLEEADWGEGNELAVPVVWDTEDPDILTAWVVRDEKRIAELKKAADNFLARLEGDYAPPVIPDEVAQLAVQYREGLDAEAAGKKRKEAARKEAEQALAGVGAAKWSIHGLSVTWSPGGESIVEVPDEEAAKAADPKLWASVERARKALEKKEAAWVELCGEHKKTEVKPGRPSFRVTPVKEKGEKK